MRFLISSLSICIVSLVSAIQYADDRVSNQWSGFPRHFHLDGLSRHGTDSPTLPFKLSPIDFQDHTYLSQLRRRIAGWGNQLDNRAISKKPTSSSPDGSQWSNRLVSRSPPKDSPENKFSSTPEMSQQPMPNPSPPTRPKNDAYPSVKIVLAKGSRSRSLPASTAPKEWLSPESRTIAPMKSWLITTGQSSPSELTKYRIDPLTYTRKIEAKQNPPPKVDSQYRQTDARQETSLKTIPQDKPKLRNNHNAEAEPILPPVKISQNEMRDLQNLMGSSTATQTRQRIRNLPSLHPFDMDPAQWKYPQSPKPSTTHQPASSSRSLSAAKTLLELHSALATMPQNESPLQGPRTPRTRRANSEKKAIETLTQLARQRSAQASPRSCEPLAVRRRQKYGNLNELTRSSRSRMPQTTRLTANT